MAEPMWLEPPRPVACSRPGRKRFWCALKPASCASRPSNVDISNMVISTAEQRPMGAPEPAGRATITPAVFQIMVALADGELHGYGIMQDVDRVTNGETKIGPGTLYRSIQRMVVDG